MAKMRAMRGVAKNFKRRANANATQAAYIAIFGEKRKPIRKTKKNGN